MTWQMYILYITVYGILHFNLQFPVYFEYAYFLMICLCHLAVETATDV